MTREKGPGLSSTGNRVLLAVAAGIAGYFFSGQVWVFVALLVVVYLITTLIARKS